jgi:Protein of unknown function (DUF3306)
MNDPENFVSRWSRRKRQAADETARPDKTVADHAADATAVPENANLKSPESGTATPSVPEFDVASLPPIESIEAGTDISAFMRKGVPSALRHAALRRAWAADPSIRDFVGLNENFWDAAGPAGVPGFGDLDPNLDVKRMLSDLFGEDGAEKPTAAPPDSSATPSSVSVAIEEATSPDAHQDTSSEASSPSTEIAAVQNESPENPPERGSRRRHGSALPE